jgi:hypothetical protein
MEAKNTVRRKKKKMQILPEFTSQSTAPLGQESLRKIPGRSSFLKKPLRVLLLHAAAFAPTPIKIRVLAPNTLKILWTLVPSNTLILRVLMAYEYYIHTCIEFYEHLRHLLPQRP